MASATVDLVSRAWVFPESRAIDAAELASRANIPPIIAQLLLARGIETAAEAERFLNPNIGHLLDPYTMLGMATAVERVQAAMRDHETILIYGDYDVDGTTAIILLKTALEMLGGAVRFHVPHRLHEGYGMQSTILADAAEAGVRLVISVDTGIRAFAEAETAAQLGLDLIVTDHHLTEAGTVPRALAVLNPNQPGCSYACKHICGAGVAFKLAQALLEAHDAANGTVRARTKILPSFLKMLAIATIADAVPLLGENRVFASIGMEQLRRPAHPGLRALFELVKLDPAKRRLTSTDIAFRIAPRINAAGRMDIASEVVELFTTKDAPRACELAEKLDRLNTDRRTEEAAILKQIEDQLADPVGGERLRAARVIVLDGDGWHRGIIGILASRVVERTNRPALVISNETQAEIAARNGGASNGSTADKIPADGTLAIGTSANGKSANGRSASGSAGQSHGSGRSVPGFHLLDAIESCRDLFSRYGGHAHAVGFSLPTALVPELRARIATYAAAHLDAECLERPLECHAELSFDEITPEFYAVLRRMEPMGMGNEEPIFVARRVRVATPPRVIKERHIKVVLTAFRPEPPQSPTQEYAPPPSSSFTALGWHWADRIKAMGIAEGSLVDIAYRLRENEHPDFGGLELEIVALELALPH